MRKVLKNKAGKGEAVLYSILAFIVIGLLGLGLVFTGVIKTKQSVTEGTVEQGGTTTGGVVVPNCALSPTLSPSIGSELSGGTIPAAYSMRAKIDGGAPKWVTTSTTIPVNSEVELLINSSMGGATNYITKALPKFRMSCGANPVVTTLLATEVPGEKILLSSGDYASESGAGLNNETASSSSITNYLEINPAPYKGTGELYVVIEANSSAKTKEIQSPYLTNLGAPRFWKTAYAGLGTTVVLKVPNINNGVSTPFKIAYTLVPVSSASLGQQDVNVTIYQAQDAEDADGTFLKSVIQDSQGTAKYANLSSFDYHINA